MKAIFITVVLTYLFVELKADNIKINPKPCSVDGKDGTCMFVWECIQTEGRHLGVCVDKFMFGTCCEHDLNDNFVLPQTTSIPFHQRKTAIKKKPLKQSSHETLTIQKPNGITIVVRRPFVSTH